MNASESQDCFVTGRRLSWVFLYVSVVLSVFWVAYQPALARYHSHQHFLRGITLSALYQNGTLPQNLVKVMRSIRQGERRSFLGRESAWKERREGVVYPGFTRTAFESYYRYRDVPLNASERAEIESPSNVNRYPAIGYFPYVFTGWVAKQLEMRPVMVIYFNVIVYHLIGILAFFFALRMLPCLQWPVFVLALMPSVIGLRSAMYPDTMTNSAAVLLFAIIVNRLWTGKQVDWKWQTALVLSGIFTAVVKLLYFPLVFVLFILPRHLFVSSRSRVAFFLMAGFLCVALSYASIRQATTIESEGFSPMSVAFLGLSKAVWLPDSMRSGLAERDDVAELRQQTQERATSDAQRRKNIKVEKLANLIADPLNFIGITYDIHRAYGWSHHFVPNFVWWSATYLPPNDSPPLLGVGQAFWIFGGLLLLAMLGIVSASGRPGSDGSGRSFLPVWSRLWLLLLVIVSVLLINLGLYLIMLPQILIPGIQGRYYIPLVFFLFLALVPNIKLERIWRSMFGWISGVLAFAVVILMHCNYQTPYHAMYDAFAGTEVLR